MMMMHRVEVCINIEYTTRQNYFFHLFFVFRPPKGHIFPQYRNSDLLVPEKKTFVLRVETLCALA